jgi:DNA-binding Lrp family transcriptional regulator
MFKAKYIYDASILLRNLASRVKNLGKVPKIDEIDIRILRALLNNARTSFATIAKDCGFSVTSIRNRFNDMVKSGIVTGSISQINPKSLGYDCVAFIKVYTNPRYSKETREAIESDSHVSIYSAHIINVGSIVGFVVTRNADDLSKVINRIRCGSYVRNIDPEIWVDQRSSDLPHNLLIGKNDTSNNISDITEKKEEKIEKLQLDSIDIALIKMLTKNARLPFRKIASELGVSTNNVIGRYNKLKKTVIPTSSITVNLEKLGYFGTGVLVIKVSNKGSVDKTFNAIIQIPNIITAIKCLGNFDIIAITPFRTLEDLTALTERISKTLDVFEFQLLIDNPYTSYPLNTVSTIITDKLL